MVCDVDAFGDCATVCYSVEECIGDAEDVEHDVVGVETIEAGPCGVVIFSKKEFVIFMLSMLSVCRSWMPFLFLLLSPYGLMMCHRSDDVLLDVPILLLMSCTKRML